MDNWRRYNGALVPLTPPHVEVDTNGVKNKIEEHNAYFARWTTDFDKKTSTEFWYVICDEKLCLEDYSRNTRSKIRRGLKKCEIRRISKNELKEYGYESYISAFKKYNTYLKPKNKEEFKREISSLNSEWEFWGIYFENKFIGYSQNKIIDKYCDYSTIKFHPAYLKHYPSYALFYTMNQYYLNEKKFQYVNDGARSISHQTNIQSFLIEKFKFRKAYCKLNIIYNKKLKLFIEILFPFRNLIKRINLGYFIKLNILLSQEKIRRDCERV